MSMSSLLKVPRQCILFLALLVPRNLHVTNCTSVKCKWPKCHFPVKTINVLPWSLLEFIMYVVICIV